ncbi:programmed cell death protein 7-like [Sycon ciliatum]|uniref:programmed cell death protein 7-like n=1 Tax=Sycon ciliatum TaxID=27933 RepID=UPI0031F71EED
MARPPPFMRPWMPPDQVQHHHQQQQGMHHPPLPPHQQQFQHRRFAPPPSRHLGPMPVSDGQHNIQRGPPPMPPGQQPIPPPGLTLPGQQPIPPPGLSPPGRQPIPPPGLTRPSLSHLSTMPPPFLPARPPQQQLQHRLPIPPNHQFGSMPAPDGQQLRHGAPPMPQQGPPPRLPQPSLEQPTTMAPSFLPVRPPNHLSTTASMARHLPGIPALTVPTSVPPAVPTQTKALPTRANDDQDWVKHWQDARGQKRLSEKGKHGSNLSLTSQTHLLANFQKISDETLQGLADLQRKVTYESPDVWDALLAKVTEACHGLASTLGQFPDADVSRLATTIRRRKLKRRKAKQRRRQHWDQEYGPGSIERRKELHQRIDEWQARRIAADISYRHEASLRNQAGGALGEVRKKQLEAQQSQDLLTVLTDLHNERKAVLHREGVDISEEDETKFKLEIERLSQLWSRQASAYDEEEQMLKVMLEEEKEEEVNRQMEKAKRSAKLRDEGKDGPTNNEATVEEIEGLAMFRSFYEQASCSVGHFVQVRHQWDMFASTEPQSSTSTLPCGWPSPPPSPSEHWKQYLG